MLQCVPCWHAREQGEADCARAYSAARHSHAQQRRRRQARAPLHQSQHRRRQKDVLRAMGRSSLVAVYCCPSATAHVFLKCHDCLGLCRVHSLNASEATGPSQQCDTRSISADSEALAASANQQLPSFRGRHDRHHALTVAPRATAARSCSACFAALLGLWGFSSRRLKDTVSKQKSVRKCK